MAPPTVRIAGGGPAGLLLALQLGSLSPRPFDVVVHERAAALDAWSSRSYSIALKEKGVRALEAAGVLEAVTAVAHERRRVVVHPEGEPSVEQALPGLVVSRPALVACLARELRARGAGSLELGCGVDRVVPPPGGGAGGGAEAGDVRLELSDGRVVACSHVVGCDGKWSRVRDSLPACWLPTWVEEGSWGVLFQPPALPDCNLPGGYNCRADADAMHIFYPRTPALRECMYGLLVPMAGGACHATLVCFDALLEAGGWPQLGPAPGGARARAAGGGWLDDGDGTAPLVPPGGARARAAGGGWLDDGDGTAPPVPPGGAARQGEERAWMRPDAARERPAPDSAGPWREALSALLAEEMPAFGAAVQDSAVALARPRASWVDLGSGSEYSALSGRVALVGDAAHAMTASLGEGCNTALESAAELGRAVAEQLAAAATASGGPGPPPGGRQPPDGEAVRAALSSAFRAYGAARPAAAREVQHRSAQASTRQRR